MERSAVPARRGARTLPERSGFMRRALTLILIAAVLLAGLGTLTYQFLGTLPALVGLLLFAFGGMLGLRVGSDSANRLLADVLRLNKVLAEQNSELADANARLLQRFSRQA